MEAVTANVFERSPRGRPWCAVIGLRFVSFGDGARRGVGSVFSMLRALLRRVILAPGQELLNFRS